MKKRAITYAILLSTAAPAFAMNLPQDNQCEAIITFEHTNSEKRDTVRLFCKSAQDLLEKIVSKSNGTIGITSMTLRKEVNHVWHEKYIYEPVVPTPPVEALSMLRIFQASDNSPQDVVVINPHGPRPNFKPDDAV